MQETAKLVDEFGRLHIYNYRDIYGKLVEKSKGLKEKLIREKGKMIREKGKVKKEQGSENSKD